MDSDFLRLSRREKELSKAVDGCLKRSGGSITGDLAVDGGGSVTGDVAVGGSLRVTGELNVSRNVTVDSGIGSYRYLVIRRGKAQTMLTTLPVDGNGGTVLLYADSGMNKGTLKLRETGVVQYSPNGSAFFDMWHDGNLSFETGIWTPSIRGATTDPSVTYTSRSGRYTKIDRFVSASVFLVVNTISGGSGNLFVGGLPFAIDNAAVGAISLGRLAYNTNYTGITVKEFGCFFNGGLPLLTYGDLGARLVTSNLLAGFVMGGTLTYYTVG